MSNIKLGLGEALLRPFPPSRPSSRNSQAPIQGQSQRDTIAAAHAAILAVLETTHWPRKSEESVKSLIDVVKQVPAVLQIPSWNYTPHETADGGVEQLVSALHNVKTKLDGAAAKHGASTKSSAFFHRSETCNQVLNACREQITGALTALHTGASNRQFRGTAPSDETQGRRTASVLQQEAALNTVVDRPRTTRTWNQQPIRTAPTPNEELAIRSDPRTDSAQRKKPLGWTNNALKGMETVSGTIPNEESAIRSDPRADSARRKKRLGRTNKALKGIEAVSGTIPIIGNYLGAAAKVGVACVELAQLADTNEEEANMLESRTTRLSEILGQFERGSASDDQIGTTRLIQQLQKELQTIQHEIKVLNSGSTLRKMWSSSDHANELKEFQEKIRVALEELQLLVNLRTSDLIAEISSRQIREENDRLLNLLGDANYGAQGHAIEDVICLPGTRVAILERIENWIRGGRDSKQVFWILGMAGRGKSTLASTVAYKWQNRASCAIFHFRRGQTELQKRLICALARQLGSSTASPIKHSILQCIRENKDIAQGRLETQFQFLVGALTNLQHPTPVLLIIDALDECEDVDYAVRFVQLIRRHAGLLPPQLKILVTCRPEAQLLVHLRQAKWEEECLDLECNMDESEIRLFVEHELSRIREDHGLPGDWPPETAIQALVQRSQRLFQWTRTALKYISVSPKHRLSKLLTLPSINDGLDGLYKPILLGAYENVKTSPADTRLLLDVLGLLVVAPHPISVEIIVYLYSDYDALRGQSEDERTDYVKKEVLEGLSSLLSLPTSSDRYIRLGHTSLRDLLVSEDRCGKQPYFVDVDQYHRLLATKCLRLMLRDLRRNICNLSNLSKPNTEIQEAVSKYVPKGLQYCTRSWSIHLRASTPILGPQMDTVGDLTGLEQFSKRKLLCWIEVMSLTGEMKESLVMAKQIKLWLEQPPAKAKSISLTTLWNDAYRFITEFQHPLSFNALHVYATALSFCPRETQLWAYYGGEAGMQVLHGQSRSEWSAVLWSRPTGRMAYCVAYSPDNKTIAAGCRDHTVRLWDAETGLPVGKPLEGHPSEVYAVAFSPDGRRIASGSFNDSIRLWDVQTGSGIGRCLDTSWRGYMESVLSVQFSPDGKTIAGGCSDNIIRLWDSETLELVGISFEGHTEGIKTLAFSPDGRRIASGSRDCTVRIWRTKTGRAIGKPFVAQDRVQCIGFSRDGRMIALTSGTAILILDAFTGVAIDGALEGDGKTLNSIDFSPDGKTIAVGGEGGKIQLWDVETRVIVGRPLVGHTGSVESLAFSPDGKKIVSTSGDQTVRLWDLATVVSADMPSEGHTSHFSSIATSPVAEKIATGTYDGKMALWNARTGLPVCGPWEGHSNRVACLSFSPDGRRLASGSFDGFIRIWDVDAGSLVGEPERGPGGWVQAVAWSPDGGVLVSGDDQGIVSLWNANTWLPIGVPLQGPDFHAQCLAFSPNGRRIASGTYDKISLWDVQTHSNVGDLSVGYSNRLRSLAFSSDGNLLFAELNDGKFGTWDLKTMQSTADSHYFAGFPEPFIYLRVHEQWVFYRDIRIFWLPSDYTTVDLLPVTLRGDVLLCLGRICCTFDIFQILPYLPVLATKPSGGLDTFTVASVTAWR